MDNILKRLKEANKSVHSYYRLRNQGYTPEKAFEKAVIRGSKFITLEIYGDIYTVKEAMKLVNCEVSYSTVMKRIKRGMTPLDAITINKEDLSR